MRILLLIIFVFFTFKSYAKFRTGVGYIVPAEYRTNNEINPLPFGLSVVPLIAYRGESLNIFGPNISYSLLKGLVGFNVDFNIVGDRYKAYEVNKRETAINAGASLRLLNLILYYGSDISGTYRGNVFKATLAHRQKITDSFMTTFSIAKEFYNKSFSNYYYGVKLSEVGEFAEYSLSETSSILLSLMLSYKLSESNSISLSFNRKEFDEKIYQSPTIALKRFNTWALFWSFDL